MIPEGELGLISLWTTPTTLDRPYYTVLYDVLAIHTITKWILDLIVLPKV